jgi:hypothetical protein
VLIAAGYLWAQLAELVVAPGSVLELLDEVVERPVPIVVVEVDDVDELCDDVEPDPEPFPATVVLDATVVVAAGPRVVVDPVPDAEVAVGELEA